MLTKGSIDHLSLLVHNDYTLIEKEFEPLSVMCYVLSVMNTQKSLDLMVSTF